MDSRKESSITKVLMVPWLAHGHISPFLELGKKLATKNFEIYLCSTPINLKSIQDKITTTTHSLPIKLIPLHIPPSPELPPHHHTTNGLPLHLLNTLKKAFQTASPDFSKIVDKLRPDLIIYDFLEPWAPATAAEYKIPAVMFITSGATLVSFGIHLFEKPGVEFPFPEVLRISGGFPKNPARDQALANDGIDDNVLVMEGFKKSSKMYLIKSFSEFEGKYMEYLSILTEKKIVPVGPLVQELDDKENSEILQWLGTKDELSTVFVSFGSESFLSKEEREEMAHGLEISGVNFMWVLRFPVGERIDLEDALPVGFLDRIGERGLVVEGWAPQVQILAHSSTGGFASHCGWSSIMESLKFGVPIIAIPMDHDQPFNSKLLEEVGVAVGVHRDENKSLNRENIAQVIRKVVKDQSGANIRSKAREFRDMIAKKGEEDIDGTAQELGQLCNDAKLLKD